jgi:hypothetical protein
MKTRECLSLLIAGLAGIWFPALAQSASVNQANRQAALITADTVSSHDTVQPGMENRAGNNAAAVTAARANEEHGRMMIVKEEGDTLVVVKKLPRFCKDPDSRKMRREKGFGLCGGFTPAVAAINTRPLKDIIAGMPPAKGRTFNLNSHDYEAMYLSGCLGYFGVGNGLRLGGGSLKGERNFQSGTYGSDSAVSLRLRVEYGGFLVEKAFVNGHANYCVGGIIGGGTMSATARLVQSDGLPVNDQGNTQAGKTITSNFFLLEVHCGATYSLVSWFHVGADASLPVFCSSQGFTEYSPMYMTVNPAFRLKIMFGTPG